jgi:uncharacterized protein (TIGR02118 family)
MIKLTVLYSHPEDPESFEKYYEETHLPLVAKAKGVAKSELTRFLPNPDGSEAAYYRMAELYFNGPDKLQQTMDSPEGQAMADDLSNFASGGVTIMVGEVGN